MLSSAAALPAGLFEQLAGVFHSADCGKGRSSLAADNEKVARSNSRAGEAILRLERIERDAKPF